MVQFVFVLEGEEGQSLDRGIEIKKENLTVLFLLNNPSKTRRQHRFSNPTFPTTERDGLHLLLSSNPMHRTADILLLPPNGDKGTTQFLCAGVRIILTFYYVPGGRNKGGLECCPDNSVDNSARSRLQAS